MRLIHLFIALLLLMTACGFHLRGSTPQAEVDAVTSVYVDGASDLAREVKAQLQSAGIAVAAEAGKAEYRLSMAEPQIERNVLSVSAETGKVEEYELRMALHLSVSRNGEPLLENELIEAARDYTFEEDAVLGKSSEEEVLREEMNRLVAERIIRRLNAAAKND